MDGQELSSKLAGRRRFWITVLSFAIANAAIWATWFAIWGRIPRDLLRVENSWPANKTVVAGRPTFSWHFNFDVRPHRPDEPPGVLNPNVPGRWKWADKRTLQFTPDTDLPKARTISINLRRERLCSAEGFQLARPHQSLVLCSPLSVVEVKQAGTDDGDRFLVEMRFSDRVLGADLVRNLKLTDANGKPVEFHLHGDAADNTLRIMTDPVGRDEAGEDRKITVRIAKGLAGTSGPLGLAEPFEQQITLETTLVANEASADCPPEGQPSIHVALNGEYELEKIRPCIAIEPAIPFVLESNYRGLLIRGDFQPGTRYAVKISRPAQVAPNDRSKYPRADTLSVFVPDRRPGVWFEHAEGYLGSRGNRTLLAHVVNATEVQVTAQRMYDNNLVAWRNIDGYPRYDGATERYAKPLAAKTIRLAAQKNKTQDLRINVDELLAGHADDGVYEVRIEAVVVEKDLEDSDRSGRYYYDKWCGRNNYRQNAVVTLSDIGLLAKAGRDATHVWAVSLSTGKPMPNIRVRVYTNKNQLIGQSFTDSTGLARIAGPSLPGGEWPNVVLADRAPAESAAMGSFSQFLTPFFVAGEDAANRQEPAGLTWLDLRTGNWNTSDLDVSGAAYHREGHIAFVYPERGVYRPGETVHLRAIVRGPEGAAPPSFPVKWQIRRPDLRDYRSQTVLLDPDGSAGFDLELPSDLPTGRWTALVGLPGEGLAEAYGSATFQVEEFMPDRIKVGLSVGGQSDDARLRIDEKKIEAKVQADYLFGQPAAGLQARLTARLDPVRFTAREWSSWTFGDHAKLIDLPDASGQGSVTARSRRSAEASRDSLTLDEKGQGTWEMDLNQILRLTPTTQPATQPTAPRYLGPWTLAVSASVMETGGRAVTASRCVTVDALPYYIGVHPANSGTAKPNRPFTYNIRLVTPDGKPSDVASTLDASLARESWNTTLVHRDGRYHYQSTRVIEPVAGTDAKLAVVDGKAEWTMSVPYSGAYILRLHDTKTGAFTSQSFYITDGRPWDDNISRENPERLEIALLPLSADAPTTLPTTMPTAGKSEFRVGQRALALVRSPFPGTLLLTVETDQVLYRHVVEIDASQAAVPIDVTEAFRPNAYVTATVVRNVQPNIKWRTHRAFGATRLTVDPADRELDVQITAAGEIRPKTSLPVSVRILDHLGRPVRNAAVTIAAVDEGILQLTDFETPDPLAFFYAPRALGVSSADIYSHLMPEVPRPSIISSIGGDGAGGGRHSTPVAAKRVKPVSLFAGLVRTDDAGNASVSFSVPEFIGSLRIMAVAHAGDSFGNDEKNTLVRSPLLVQSSFPRFCAPGDRFDVPLIVFNNSGNAGEASIRIQLLEGEGGGENPIRFVDAEKAPSLPSPGVPGEGRVLDLPVINVASRGQNATSFALEAKQACGAARIGLSARMGNETFEENLELPVRPPSPVITRGGYASGSADMPLRIPVPGGLMCGTETIDIKVTPWPTLNLPGGLDYLDRYPYGCCEQTISKCFPLVYLSDIGAKIAPGVFEKDHVATKVNSGIIRLMGMQTSDGGVAFWAGGRESWPWGSVYVAHFLIEAENAGHTVPADFRQRLLSYLRHRIEAGGENAEALESNAYACYVLAIAGKPDRAAMSRLLDLANSPHTSTLPAEAPQRAQAKLFLSLGWLAAGRRDLAVDLLPKTPPLPRKDRQLGGNIGSPIRDRALLVNTMLAVEPQNPALPAMVQQLADAIKSNRWQSTQDASFSVMAIGRYLRQAKAEQPYTSAELWLGEKKLASIENGGNLVYTADLRGNKLEAAEATISNYELRLTGPAGAKAHVTWLQNGIPMAAPIDQDAGMSVRRWYLTETGGSLPSTTLRSGQLVKVAITIEAPPGAENIVIEDLLPGGLEIENPRLHSAASAAAGPETNREGAIFNVTRLDVRDDRLVIVGHMPFSAKARFEYLARAVSPGTYIVPPLRGECMYDVGIMSLSGGGGKITVAPADAKTAR